MNGNYLLVLGFAASSVLTPSIADDTDQRAATPPLRGALIRPADVTTTRLAELANSGTNTIVFALRDSSDEGKQAVRTAVAQTAQAGLEFAYWIEVARSPELANQHPDWMASLQTHQQWRRLFPDVPQPNANEVVKTYPWVPILSREPFAAQRQRVLALLADMPQPTLIFLNDLQGAPSACGCGNPLCRWTSDYGKRRTTIPLGDEAAALFVKAIQTAKPGAEVVPVWTTECEEHDGSADGLCAGVGCFQGICWKASTRQLMPVAVTSNRLAVLALYKEFERDTSHYGRDDAGWIEFAIKTFQTMPPRHNGTAIAARRMIAILQGWDVTATEIDAQQAAAGSAGANGWVVAYDKIDQSWSPKVLAWK
jgi:hypothetical protein